MDDVPGMIRPDLQALPQVRDRMTFLYLEHCTLGRQDGTITVTDEKGIVQIPAIEAFGAAHVLQEILTIKSDDVVGRSKAYEAIVKGEPMPTPGIPESLNVLLHELRGLCLSITLE